MASFADIDPRDIREDCRFHTGYKPCGKHDGCPGCPAFQPRGTEILVIKIGAMGDVLRTKCLLPALKRAHPQSWITWITAPGSEPIARDPLVDQVLAYDADGLMALEGRRFDLVLSLDKEPGPLALSRKVDAARRVGFAPTAANTATVWNDGAAYALRLGLSDELKFRRNTLTHQEILHQVAELPYAGDRFGLVVGDRARAAAAQALAAQGVPPDARVVALNAGCGPVFLTKQWPAERFAELASAIVAETGAWVALLGGPREREQVEAVAALLPPEARARVALPGCGHPLEVFFALVERASVLVTADTLALHVGVATGRWVVAFFGPTCHQEIDLHGRGEKIVTDYPCSPCYLKECDVRPSCMQAQRARPLLEAVVRGLAAA